MDISINNIAKNLATNILSLRKKQNLTQARLAKIANTTRASIAQIESGSANPTLELLFKISRALQVSIDELTSVASADCNLIPAKNIQEDRRSKNGVKLRKLLPNTVYAHEFDELHLQPGAVLKGSPHIEGTKEYFTCIEGSVLIAVLGKIYEVKKGDVFSFPGDKPHSYQNKGKRTAKGVSVVIFKPS